MSEQRVVHYHTNHGIRTAIVSEGRKKLAVVMMVTHPPRARG